MSPVLNTAIAVMAALTLANAPAFADCQYCEEWRAFSGDPYVPGSVAIATESTIALPTCTAVAYELVESKPSHTLVGCTDYFLRLQSPPVCDRVPTERLRPFVKIIACPPTPSGNEELEISLLQEPRELTTADKIDRYFGGSWRFIRKAYDPCDSGGGHGQWMCSMFRRERAEARLEVLSHSLGLKSQTRWLQDRDRRCSQRDHTFSESWSYQEEEVCKLRLTEQRIRALSKRSR